jgi:hypothetical protein
MTTRERWGLTLFLEQYLYLPNDVNRFDAVRYDGAWRDKVIRQGLNLLFEKEVFTPEEMQDYLKQHFGINLSRHILSKWAEGEFVEIRLLEQEATP